MPWQPSTLRPTPHQHCPEGSSTDWPVCSLWCKLIGSFTYAFCVHVNVIDTLLSVQLRKVLLIYNCRWSVFFFFWYNVLCFYIDAISWFVMIAIQLEGPKWIAIKIKSSPFIFIFSIILRSFTIFSLWATIGFENSGIMDQMFEFGFWELVRALLLSVTVQHCELNSCYWLPLQTDSQLKGALDSKFTLA